MTNVNWSRVDEILVALFYCASWSLYRAPSSGQCYKHDAASCHLVLFCVQIIGLKPHKYQKLLIWNNNPITWNQTNSYQQVIIVYKENIEICA